MLIPRRVKHRKQHHPKRSGKAKGGTAVSFGDFGLQATEGGYVTNRQIEAARIAMTRHIKRGGKVWINIYPDRPLTRSLLKLVWVPVRVHQNSGLLTSSQAAFFSRSPASLLMLQTKRSLAPHTNFQSSPAL